MKWIKPSEISARILTLLDESDERVIIVSPYMKISKWYKFINKVNGLRARNIIPEVYVRDDPENKDTYRDLDQLALEYQKIPHLHCKLYMNEKNGIVTSMNLLLSSDINSLEIGYATETWNEYTELFEFYHRYIKMGETVQGATIAGKPTADIKEVMHSIREELNAIAKNSWLWLAGNTLHISTGRNNFNVSINEGRLRITACLRMDSATNRKSVRHYTSIRKKVKDLTTMKIIMDPGSKPDGLQITGEAQHTLKSMCIAGIMEDEAAYIVTSVIKFIAATDDLVV